MTRFRTMIATGAALIGLAVPSIGFADAASATPSRWHTVHEEASEVIPDACPGLDVLWEITVDSKWRYITRGKSGLPLREERTRDIEVYTNLATGEWVTVINRRSEHPLRVTDNGDGTLTYVYVHHDHQVMFGQDGRAIVKLRTGWIVIVKTFDNAGTPRDPSDDELISFEFPNGTDSSGHNADFCTELIQAIG
jgi:hypothetical protein